LVETACALDLTRLVSAACLVSHVRFRIEDRRASVLDVIGINEYFGWYFPDYEKLVAIGHTSDPDRPVVITETGADGVKTGGPASGFFSEDYRTEVYHRQIDILGRLDYIRGMSPWILYDFRAEKRMNRYQRGWNREGLIVEDMRRALAPEEDDIAEGRGSCEGDATFHRLVAESSQNEALVATSEGLWSIHSTSPASARIHTRILDQTYRKQWTFDHREILRGLERRDPESARAAMRRHLGNVSDTLMQLSDPELSLQSKSAPRRRTLRQMQ
jgi:hypothetical protein